MADTSLSGVGVDRELDRLIGERGKLKMIVSDNGTEFIGNAILSWAESVGVEWHSIAPSKPTQNCYFESFNGRLVKEMPFSSPAQAKAALANWRTGYNTSRPHTKIGWHTHRVCDNLPIPSDSDALPDERLCAGAWYHRR